MAESPEISVHLTALGVPILVRVTGTAAEELAEKIRRAWNRCDDPVRRPPHRVIDVRLGDTDELALAVNEPSSTVVTGTSQPAVMDALAPVVTRAAISARAGGLLMLHACAVGDPVSGNVVALVGPSGAGKTTAAVALASRFAYLTDETVGVEPDRSVVAYPKPLSRRRDGSIYKEQVSGDDLGLQPGFDGGRLVGVIALARDSPGGPARAVVEQVRLLDALALLAPETSYLSRLDRPLHRLAQALGPGLTRVRYRDAEQLPAVVAACLRPSGGGGH